MPVRMVPCPAGGHSHGRPVPDRTPRYHPRPPPAARAHPRPHRRPLPRRRRGPRRSPVLGGHRPVQPRPWRRPGPRPRLPPPEDPATSAVSEIFRAIDRDAFAAALGAWAQRRQADGTAIALDGTTLKSSRAGGPGGLRPGGLRPRRRAGSPDGGQSGGCWSWGACASPRGRRARRSCMASPAWGAGSRRGAAPGAGAGPLWRIGNGLPFVGDVTLGEGACRVRRGSAP